MARLHCVSTLISRHLASFGAAERLAETVDAFITSGQMLCSRTQWYTIC